MRKIENELYYRRRAYLAMIIAVFTFQMTFSVLILQNAYANGDLRIRVFPEMKVGLIRFFAGMVMHVECNDEIFNGF